MPKPGTYSVANWEKFQHYQKRRPPWIKLYVSLMDSYDYEALSNDAQLLHLQLLLLAAKTDNEIPMDLEWIAGKIPARFSPEKIAALLSELVKKDLGCVSKTDASKLLAHDARAMLATDASKTIAPDREETETETEAEKRYPPPRKRDEDRQKSEALFAQFWAMYPKKAGKQAAMKAWHRQEPPWLAVQAAIVVQRECEQWQDSKFIPHASTWLNGRRWEDDPSAYERRTPPKPQTGVDNAIRELLAEEDGDSGFDSEIGGGVPEARIDEGESPRLRGGPRRHRDGVPGSGYGEPAEILEVFPDDPGDPREGVQRRARGPDEYARAP